MQLMTRTKSCAYPLTSALLTMATAWSLGLAAPVPARADFWVRDQPGRITHACTAAEPLVICLQGRKVVMQARSDPAHGFSYTARFFNVARDVEKQKILFVAGRELSPDGRVNDRPLKSEFPSAVTFDGLLTVTYPAAEGVVVTRTVYPSRARALVVEEWQVRNIAGERVTVTVAPARKVTSVGEDVAIVWSCPGVKAASVEAGGVLSFSTCVQARLAAEPDLAVNVAAERGGAPGFGRGGLERTGAPGNSRAGLGCGIRLAETPCAGKPDRDDQGSHHPQRQPDVFTRHLGQ